MNAIFTLLFLIMFANIVLSYFKYRKPLESSSVETFQNATIQFLNKKQFTAFLLKDPDDYYSTLHKNDLKSRHIKSVSEYKKIIPNSTCQGSFAVKQKIQKCIRAIQTKLESKQGKVVHGIRIRKILTLPWVIGFICDNKYEFGFPHTRTNVIVLNVSDVIRRSEKELCKLLLHEKVHVYQKKYESEMDAYFERKGFKIVGGKNKETMENPANPDTDSKIYNHLETNVKYYAKYNKNPQGAHDIVFSKNHSKYEHPLEKIAYDMETIL